MHMYQRLCSLLVLLVLTCSSAAFAQIRSATITGTVTDPQKAAVPGATVTVTNQDTNVSAEFVTTESGLFTAPYLPAGTYTVTVTLTGFSPYKRTGVAVAATETVRVPVELTVGQLGETVSVSAEAPLLQTDRTSVSGAVGAEMIEALPNITQNPLAYAFLQAGAVPRVSASQTDSLNSFGIGVDGRRQWSAVGINGGRAFTNDIQLDGLPVMGGGYNEAAVVPNTEGLQEVRVISNNFSAEYGRGQAIISMSTKSGTNAFHGNGAYTLRHEKLNANSFENNAREFVKARFRVDDVGGSLGGPILRNRLFFFSSYHGLRNDQTSTQLQTVPTALERAGNFSQTLIRNEAGNPVPARIFDPLNVVQEGPDLFRRAEFPNAIIPNPDPFALRIFSFYPMPNRTPDDVLQPEQLRGRHHADRSSPQLEQPCRLQVQEPFALRQRRHLVRRDRDAAAVRYGAVQRRTRASAATRTPISSWGCRGPRPDARARRSLRPEPDQYHEHCRQQDRVRRLRVVRRAEQPSSAHPVPGERSQREPERLRRGQRWGQQLERDDDRQLQYETRIPDESQPHRQRDQNSRQVGAQRRRRVPESAVELPRS